MTKITMRSPDGRDRTPCEGSSSVRSGRACSIAVLYRAQASNGLWEHHAGAKAAAWMAGVVDKRIAAFALGETYPPCDITNQRESFTKM